MLSMFTTEDSVEIFTSACLIDSESTISESHCTEKSTMLSIRSTVLLVSISPIYFSVVDVSPTVSGLALCRRASPKNIAVSAGKFGTDKVLKSSCPLDVICSCSLLFRDPLRTYKYTGITALKILLFKCDEGPAFTKMLFGQSGRGESSDCENPTGVKCSPSKMRYGPVFKFVLSFKTELNKRPVESSCSGAAARSGG